MGMVDAKSRFIWASVGCPGNNHDSVTFWSTGLFTKLTGYNLPPYNKLVEGVNVPFVILADSAFLHLLGFKSHTPILF